MWIHPMVKPGGRRRSENVSRWRHKTSNHKWYRFGRLFGSAWGLGKFVNRYQGCTIASDSTREYNFYRWHVPDAIYFNKDIRVIIQQIGGGMSKEVQELFKKG